MKLSLIVAAASNNVIGRDNGLIWHLSSDLKRFKALTSGHTILMGRKTYESIGRALPNRRNIVLSRNKELSIAGVEVITDIAQLSHLLSENEEVFVMGGGTLYREFWDKAENLYLTRVHATPAGDTHIPAIDPDCWEELRREDFDVDDKNELPYSFIDYTRK